MLKNNKADSAKVPKLTSNYEIMHITVIGFANKANSGATKVAAKRKKNT
jgi:hypothetical protein